MSLPQGKPSKVLRMKRDKKLADLDGRAAESLPPVSGTTITRYAPGFVLQFHVNAGETAGLLRRFNEVFPEKVV